MKKQITLSELSDKLAQTKIKKKRITKSDRANRTVGGMGKDNRTSLLQRRDRGNKLYDKELMLWLYLLQNLYNLSDMQTAEQVIDTHDILCDLRESLHKKPKNL